MPCSKQDSVCTVQIASEPPTAAFQKPWWSPLGDSTKPFSCPAEDAELGRRLKRALYTTVLFDPDIKCLHDDPPTIDDLARRQQDLGWSTSYMAWRHDDYTLIVGTGASQPTDEFWKELESNLNDSIDNVESLLSEVRAHLESEQDGERLPGPDPSFPEKVQKDWICLFLKRSHQRTSRNSGHDSSPIECGRVTRQGALKSFSQFFGKIF